VAAVVRVAAVVVADPAIAATSRNLGRDRVLNATLRAMRFAAALVLLACAPSYSVPDVRDAEVPPITDASPFVDARRSDAANLTLDASTDAGAPDASPSLLLPGCSIAFATREGVFKPSAGWGTIINGVQDTCTFGMTGMSCILTQGVLGHFSVYDGHSASFSATDNRWVMDLEFAVSKTFGNGEVVVTQAFGANYQFQIVYRVTAPNTTIVSRAIGRPESMPVAVDPMKPVVAHVELDKGTQKIHTSINGIPASTILFGSGVSLTGVQVGPYLAAAPVFSQVRVDYARYLAQTCPN
jgi:hypothetical protein